MSLKSLRFVAMSVLAVSFLLAAQVQADITFTFGLAPKQDPGQLPTQQNSNYADYAGVANYLKLTAAENANKTGVDFVFTSDWTGGDNSVNGGRGDIWHLNYSEYQSSDTNGSIYVNHANDVFAIVESRNAIRTTGYDKDNGMGVLFSLNYFGEGNWDTFINAINSVDNPLSFDLTLGGLDSTVSAGDYATFITNGSVSGTPAVTPEPATLLILGGGLAGLGLVARRRKK